MAQWFRQIFESAPTTSSGDIDYNYGLNAQPAQAQPQDPVAAPENRIPDPVARGLMADDFSLRDNMRSRDRFGPVNFEDNYGPQTEAGEKSIDLGLKLAQGTVMGSRMIVDAFGADSDVSESFRGAEQYLDALMSAGARDDKQEIARLAERAKNEGFLDQLVTGFEMLSVDPAGTIVQALGTSVPIIAGTVLTTLTAGPVAGLGVGLGLGATQGSGIVKGAIYETVKQELLKIGMPEQEAESRAVRAQEWGGENTDQILTGAGITALGAITGLESAAVNALIRKFSQDVAKKTSVQVGTNIALEGITEGVQGFQEQTARNIATQRQGDALGNQELSDTPTTGGSYAQGMMEFGAGMGAATTTAPLTMSAQEEQTPSPVTTSSPNYGTVEIKSPKGGNLTVSTISAEETEVLAGQPMMARREYVDDETTDQQFTSRIAQLVNNNKFVNRLPNRATPERYGEELLRLTRTGAIAQDELLLSPVYGRLVTANDRVQVGNTETFDVSEYDGTISKEQFLQVLGQSTPSNTMTWTLELEKPATKNVAPENAEPVIDDEQQEFLEVDRLRDQLGRRRGYIEQTVGRVPTFRELDQQNYGTRQELNYAAQYVKDKADFLTKWIRVLSDIQTNNQAINFITPNDIDVYLRDQVIGLRRYHGELQTSFAIDPDVPAEGDPVVDDLFGVLDSMNEAYGEYTTIRGIHVAQQIGNAATGDIEDNLVSFRGYTEAGDTGGKPFNYMAVTIAANKPESALRQVQDMPDVGRYHAEFGDLGQAVFSRLSEVYDNDGLRYLHIEELQSDLLNQGVGEEAKTPLAPVSDMKLKAKEIEELNRRAENVRRYRNHWQEMLSVQTDDKDGNRVDYFFPRPDEKDMFFADGDRSPLDADPENIKNQQLFFGLPSKHRYFIADSSLYDMDPLRIADVDRNDALGITEVLLNDAMGEIVKNDNVQTASQFMDAVHALAPELNFAKGELQDLGNGQKKLTFDFSEAIEERETDKGKFAPLDQTAELIVRYDNRGLDPASLQMTFLGQNLDLYQNLRDGRDARDYFNRRFLRYIDELITAKEALQLVINHSKTNRDQRGVLQYVGSNGKPFADSVFEQFQQSVLAGLAQSIVENTSNLFTQTVTYSGGQNVQLYELFDKPETPATSLLDMDEATALETLKSRIKDRSYLARDFNRRLMLERSELDSTMQLVAASKYPKPIRSEETYVPLRDSLYTIALKKVLALAVQNGYDGVSVSDYKSHVARWGDDAKVLYNDVYGKRIPNTIKKLTKLPVQMTEVTSGDVKKNAARRADQQSTDSDKVLGQRVVFKFTPESAAKIRNEGFVFARQGETPSVSVTTEQAVQAAQDLAKRLNVANDIRISISDGELAEGVKGAVLRDGHIIISAKAHASVDDVKQTILHEMVGHYGIRRILSQNDLSSLMTRINLEAQRSSEFKTQLDEVRKRGYDEGDPMVFVEEVLAMMAETELSQFSQLKNDIVAIFTRLMRALGIDTSVISRAEVLQLLGQSKRALQNTPEDASVIGSGNPVDPVGDRDMPAKAINVRVDKKAGIDYAELIIDGEKTYETRDTDSLRPYVGKRVGISKTGSGQARGIGSVEIGEPIVVDEKEFRRLESEHRVPKGSQFDIKSGGKKYLYPVSNPQRFNTPKNVGRGIVGRALDDDPAFESRRREGDRAGYFDMTQENVDTNIRNADAPQYYGADQTKGYFVRMPIEDFIALTTTDEYMTDRLLQDYSAEGIMEMSNIERLQEEGPSTSSIDGDFGPIQQRFDPKEVDRPNLDATPFLILSDEEDALGNPIVKVTGHEGRHRAALAYQEGARTMPVFIQYEDKLVFDFDENRARGGVQDFDELTASREVIGQFDESRRAILPKGVEATYPARKRAYDVMTAKAESTEVSLRLFEAIINNPEGFTVDAFTGEAQEGGYIVAPLKQTEIVVDRDEMDISHIEQLVDNIFLLQSVVQNGVVRAGGWYNSEDGKYYLDAVVAMDTLEDALYTAEAGDQIAIFDLNTFEEVNTNEGIENLRQAGVYNRATRDDARAGQKAASRKFDQIRGQDQGDRPAFFRKDEAGPVSSSLPTSKKPDADPLKERLIVSLDRAKTSPDYFKKITSTIKGYGNWKTSKRNPNAIAEDFIDLTVNNLLYLHDSVPEEIRQRSKLWYVGANKLSAEVADKYDFSVSQVAGVMAAMSPQKDWYQNYRLGELVIESYQNGDKSFDKTMNDWVISYREKKKVEERKSKKKKKMSDVEFDRLFAKILAEVDGRSLFEVEGIYKAHWIRAYVEANLDRRYRIVEPEGALGDFATTQDGTETNAAFGSMSEIFKAVSILLDGSPENISSQLGDQHKVRSFYNNILAPMDDQGDVTIDTHAVAAALLLPFSASSTEVLHNFGDGAASTSVQGLNGTYPLYAEGYRRAAQQRNVLPREMQSITWEAVRGLFPRSWKSKENLNKSRQIWLKYKAGGKTLDEVRNEIIEFAGGITNPDWAD